MNSEYIYLEKIDKDALLIKGLELNMDYYSEEFKSDEFTYEDTVTINLITYCDSLDNAIYSEYLVNEHTKDEDINIYKFKNDGLVRITHIIMPKASWFEKYAELYGDPKESFNYVYIYDNQHIYKYKNEGFLIVPIEEILELNTFSGVTMTRSETYSFNFSYLEECFIDKYKEFLHRVCPLNKCNEEKDVLMDIAWMGLYTIKYYLNLHRYFDAQRLLESLEGCNGVCVHTALNQMKRVNCGCAKKP